MALVRYKRLWFSTDKLDSDYKQTVVEMCFVLQRNNCEMILARHGIYSTKDDWYLGVENVIKLMLYVFEQYRHARKEIKRLQQNITDIHYAINIPGYKLTHLQLFIHQKKYAATIDINMVRLMIWGLMTGA